MWKDIAEKIQEILDNILFEQLLEEIEQFAQYYNSYVSLVTAVLKGQIQYLDGRFYGKFNTFLGREIVKLGGKYNLRYKAYEINEEKLPNEIKKAINIANRTYEKMYNKVLEKLDNIKIDKALEKLDLKKDFTETIYKVDSKFVQDAKKVVGIIPEISDKVKANLLMQYQNNLKLSINNFAANEIVSLREKVNKNIFTYGYRAETLIDTIQDAYGVSERKAEFLAKQETSLLVSKFREERYKEIGIEEYRWSTSKDSRVRGDHKKLHGKIFKWDEPPIVDEATGKRANPGEDFGCRCVAIPIVGDK